MKDDIVKMQDFVVRVVNNGGFVVARAKELYWPSEIMSHSAFSTLAEVFAHIEDIYAREIIKIPKTQCNIFLRKWQTFQKRQIIYPSKRKNFNYGSMQKWQRFAPCRCR